MLAGKRPGEKVGRLTAEQAEMWRLTRELARANKRLHTTEAALDIMGKAHALLESLSERADCNKQNKSADRNLRNADRTWCIDKAGSHIDRAGPLDRDSPTATQAPRARLRWRHNQQPGPVNKLTDLERRRVLEVLTSDRFVDLAPLQIYAQLLDEGVYLCSVSADVPGVGGEHAEFAERRRLARHPSQVCRELVATAPRQVYSWDITKLAGPVGGTYFDAYVMIDIYSRYLVGVHVHTHESGVLAKELMEQILGRPRRPAGRARRSGNVDDQQDRRLRSPIWGDQVAFAATGVQRQPVLGVAVQDVEVRTGVSRALRITL